MAGRTMPKQARRLAIGVTALLAVSAFSGCLTSAPKVTSNRLAVASAGRAYGATLQAAGGVAPYRWAASGLPAGLSISGNRIVGTPTAAGTSTVTIKVTDRARASSSRALTLHVASDLQGQAVSALNAERTKAGLAPYGSNTESSTKAQRWAEQLARNGALSHSVLFDDQPSCMRSAGENVGFSSTIGGVMSAWMASAIHHGNIVDPRFTRVGMGVASAGGHLWVVAEFLGGC